MAKIEADDHRMMYNVLHADMRRAIELSSVTNAFILFEVLISLMRGLYHAAPSAKERKQLRKYVKENIIHTLKQQEETDRRKMH